MPDSYPFNTYTGLLTPEHYKRIGNAIWLFLWCISSTTAEKEKDGVVWGIVKGNQPQKAEDLADVFGVAKKTVLRWLDDLEAHGYIKITRAPYGLILTVRNSKKYRDRVDKNVHSPNREETKLSTLEEREDRNVQSGVDRNVLSNKDIIKDLTTTANANKDSVDLIADKFAELKTIQQGKPLYPTAEDYQEIVQIVVRGVSVPQTIEFLEQCFADYQRRKPNGKITSFKYCKDYILEHFEASQAKEEAKKLAKRRIPEDGKEHKRSPGKTQKKEPTKSESITGGQVGWLGRKKLSVPEVPGSDGIY